ncbi:MAG: hypothetical protein JXO44_08570 [Clostridia bacterium]|nr:hypothetical protein [Clostridia bacterium]
MDMNMNMFVKYIKLDEEKRIIIALQDHLAGYLQEEQSKKMLKETAEKVLADDFKLLEVAKSSCRITVAEGTEEASMAKVEQEIVKGIEMAMAFMSQMGGQAPQE